MSEKPKHLGRKITFYVPEKDEPLMAEVRALLDKRRAAGFSSSFSYELLELVRVGLRVNKRRVCRG